VVAPLKRTSGGSSEADRKAADNAGLSVLTGVIGKPCRLQLQPPSCKSCLCTRGVDALWRTCPGPGPGGVWYAVVLDGTDDKLGGGAGQLYCQMRCRWVLAVLAHPRQEGPVDSRPPLATTTCSLLLWQRLTQRLGSSLPLECLMEVARAQTRICDVSI